jgi:hypothetical protein
MGEKYEAKVSQVVYAGPHPVEPGIYEIEVKVEASPGAPWEYIGLRFGPAEATFLAHMLQSNQPGSPADDHLLERVAAHDT